jgi:hypothetical protein
MSCLLQKEETELPYAVNVTLTSTLLRKKEVRIYPVFIAIFIKLKQFLCDVSRMYSKLQ